MAAARSSARIRSDTPSTTTWWATSEQPAGAARAGSQPNGHHHAGGRVEPARPAVSHARRCRSARPSCRAARSSGAASGDGQLQRRRDRARSTSCVASQGRDHAGAPAPRGQVRRACAAIIRLEEAVECAGADLVEPAPGSASRHRHRSGPTARPTGSAAAARRASAARAPGGRGGRTGPAGAARSRPARGRGPPGSRRCCRRRARRSRRRRRPRRGPSTRRRPRTARASRGRARRAVTGRPPATAGLGQRAPVDLAVGGERERVEHDERARHHVLGQPVGAPAAQLVGGAAASSRRRPRSPRTPTRWPASSRRRTSRRPGAPRGARRARASTSSSSSRMPRILTWLSARPRKSSDAVGGPPGEVAGAVHPGAVARRTGSPRTGTPSAPGALT